MKLVASIVLCLLCCQQFIKCQQKIDNKAITQERLSTQEYYKTAALKLWASFILRDNLLKFFENSLITTDDRNLYYSKEYFIQALKYRHVDTFVLLNYYKCFLKQDQADQLKTALLHICNQYKFIKCSCDELLEGLRSNVTQTADGRWDLTHDLQDIDEKSADLISHSIYVHPKMKVLRINSTDQVQQALWLRISHGHYPLQRLIGVLLLNTPINYGALSEHMYIGEFYYLEKIKPKIWNFIVQESEIQNHKSMASFLKTLLSVTAKHLEPNLDMTVSPTKYITTPPANVSELKSMFLKLSENLLEFKDVEKHLLRKVKRDISSQNVELEESMNSIDNDVSWRNLPMYYPPKKQPKDVYQVNIETPLELEKLSKERGRTWMQVTVALPTKKKESNTTKIKLNYETTMDSVIEQTTGYVIAKAAHVNEANGREKAGERNYITNGKSFEIWNANQSNDINDIIIKQGREVTEITKKIESDETSTRASSQEEPLEITTMKFELDEGDEQTAAEKKEKQEDYEENMETTTKFGESTISQEAGERRGETATEQGVSQTEGSDKTIEGEESNGESNGESSEESTEKTWMKSEIGERHTRSTTENSESSEESMGSTMKQEIGEVEQTTTEKQHSDEMSEEISESSESNETSGETTTKKQRNDDINESRKTKQETMNTEVMREKTTENYESQKKSMGLITVNRGMQNQGSGRIFEKMMNNLRETSTLGMTITSEGNNIIPKLQGHKGSEQETKALIEMLERFPYQLPHERIKLIRRKKSADDTFSAIRPPVLEEPKTIYKKNRTAPEILQKSLNRVLTGLFNNKNNKTTPGSDLEATNGTEPTTDMSWTNAKLFYASGAAKKSKNSDNQTGEDQDSDEKTEASDFPDTENTTRPYIVIAIGNDEAGRLSSALGITKPEYMGNSADLGPEEKDAGQQENSPDAAPRFFVENDNETAQTPINQSPEAEPESPIAIQPPESDISRRNDEAPKTENNSEEITKSDETLNQVETTDNPPVTEALKQNSESVEANNQEVTENAPAQGDSTGNSMLEPIEVTRKSENTRETLDANRVSGLTEKNDVTEKTDTMSTPNSEGTSGFSAYSPETSTVAMISTPELQLSQGTTNNGYPPIDNNKLSDFITNEITSLLNYVAKHKEVIAAADKNTIPNNQKYIPKTLPNTVESFQINEFSQYLSKRNLLEQLDIQWSPSMTDIQTFLLVMKRSLERKLIPQPSSLYNIMKVYLEQSYLIYQNNKNSFTKTVFNDDELWIAQVFEGAAAPKNPQQVELIKKIKKYISDYDSDDSEEEYLRSEINNILNADLIEDFDVLAPLIDFYVGDFK